MLKERSCSNPKEPHMKVTPRQVLAVLTTPHTVTTTATKLQVSRDVAKKHLVDLEKAGLVRRSIQNPWRVGRPSHLFEDSRLPTCALDPVSLIF
jgi:predicted ArsR family transcriptional regulator